MTTKGMAAMVLPCVAVLFSMGEIVRAQEKPESLEWQLPEWVVTASRAQRDQQSEPWSVYTVDALWGVNSAGRRTTAGMLSGIPSVMIQKTSNAQTSPYLRGFTGYQTLALIDGIRLNNTAFRSGPNQYWNTIDLYSVQRYEVVLGPGAVLYGSDAVGGVVNALTPEIPDWAGESHWENTLHYRAASAERSQMGRWSLAARPSPSVGFVGGVTWKDFGDVRGGRSVGRQRRTGYDEYAMDGKIQYVPTPDLTWTLAHQSVVQEDAWRTHRTVYGRTDWQGLQHGDDHVHRFDQMRHLTYVRLDAVDPFAFADHMQWTVSRHVQDEEQERVRANLRRQLDGFTVDSYGVGLQMQSRHSLGALVYGADYYHDRVTSFGREYNADGTLGRIALQGPLAADGRYDLAGAFAQNTVPVMNEVADIVVGARYTFARADARRVEDPATGEPISFTEQWQALTGSARLLVPVTEDRRHVTYLGVSQGFRTPTMHDLTSFGVARSDEIEIPAPDLGAEEFVTYEIGWKSRTRDWVLQAGYYYTQIDGLIVKTATGRERQGEREVTKSNSGDGFVQGIEFQVRWRGHAQWSAWVSGSWQEGRTDVFTLDGEKTTQREYVSRLMPPTAQSGIRWQATRRGYWAEAVGDFAAKADRLSEGDRRDSQRIPEGGTPGYAVATVRAGTVIGEGLTLVLSVENVFNTDYRIHGSGVNEPGRNWIATAQWTF